MQHRKARRRKFLELCPEAATNQDPVLFKSSIIPWWAWLKRSYLPEAELLNGRAAMVGFCMAYFVDALTGLDVVGQAGNYLCKAGLFLTVTGVVFFRQTENFLKLQKLADDAMKHDRQWQASWQDQNAGIGTSYQRGNKV
ncbi:light-harvesting complex-like protein 3 isotype 1, chloroplastic [Malania oleifera]|uniref:light-harvesting complex-like protein 3 isotype 1, chloroplastic n=1 Tax=Malania oleifera TaxID=397392 RepID=UPI0025ADB0C3|nr:light-harvesting complex-like protein 3 isotype 1, chloroplastic [Malania oleifera]